MNVPLEAFSKKIEIKPPEKKAEVEEECSIDLYAYESLDTDTECSVHHSIWYMILIWSDAN